MIKKRYKLKLRVISGACLAALLISCSGAEKVPGSSPQQSSAASSSAPIEDVQADDFIFKENATTKNGKIYVSTVSQLDENTWKIAEGSGAEYEIALEEDGTLRTSAGEILDSGSMGETPRANFESTLGLLFSVMFPEDYTVVDVKESIELHLLPILGSDGEVTVSSLSSATRSYYETNYGDSIDQSALEVGLSAAEISYSKFLDNQPGTVTVERDGNELKSFT